LAYRISHQEDTMVDKNGKAQEGKQDMPDQNRSGARDGQGASGGSGQSGGGEGAGRSRQSGFVHSSPDANVFPAGAPQSDRGDAGSRAGDSAAGTPDEGKLGGSGGTSASGTTGNDPDR
jgi:hypothetical protein